MTASSRRAFCLVGLTISLFFTIGFGMKWYQRANVGLETINYSIYTCVFFWFGIVCALGAFFAWRDIRNGKDLFK